MQLKHVDRLTKRIRVTRSLKALERCVSPQRDLDLAESYLDKSEGYEFAESFMKTARDMLINDQLPQTPDGWREVLSDDQVEKLKAKLIDYDLLEAHPCQSPPTPKMITGLYVRLKSSVELREVGAESVDLELTRLLLGVAFKVVKRDQRKLHLKLPQGSSLIVHIGDVEWVPDHDVHRWSLPHTLATRLSSMSLELV